MIRPSPQPRFRPAPRRRWLGLTCGTLSLAATLALQSASADEPPPTSPSATAIRLSNQELADGWIQLFDGETTFGWQAVPELPWRAVDGTLACDDGAIGLLCTTSEFADYLLHVEFRASADTNSGVFLRTPPEPKNPATDCYELNIAAPAVSPFATGSLVERQKATNVPPSTDWQTFLVSVQGGHIAVDLNGQRVLDYTDPKPLARGRIGLQHNRGAIAFRNIKLKPLSLTPLFNGQDLSGWHAAPDHRSVFSVSGEGYLRVQNGNGQLETDGRYADFVLQLEVQTRGRGLNSGVFFRNVPGEFWQGYESQIHNAFRRGDRNQPVDFGTGGFYRRQPARRVVADDLVWFHKTLVVSGPHMATWVNGYPVSDWEDTRPPNDNPRQGLRLAAGTIALQGHDPTTDLLFRNLRIAEMPAR